MASLFASPKSPELPKPPPPPKIPQAGDETSDWAARLARQRSGFRKTIVTGALEPESTGKKRLLGGE